MTSSKSSAFKFPFSSFDSETLSKYLPKAESVSAFAKETLEASSASTRASVKGMQDAGQSMAEHVKSQFDLSVETGKKLVKADSLQDAFSIQSGYVKSAFEKNVQNFNDMSDLFVDTFAEALAPFAKQTKKVTKAAKAA